MEEKYARAYTEVLEIISHFSDEEYSKIPEEKIRFFEDNKDENYYFRIDPSIDLAEQNISKEANAILVILFRDYYATEEQKVKLKEILEINQKIEDEAKREKYNPDEIFKNKRADATVNENMQMVEYKESFFTKFKNFILKIFNINKK